MELLLALAVFCGSIASANSQDDQLVLVQAVWRHGDRSPTGTFKSDPYQESAWPQGWGQLSPEGMEQHMWLGQKLAARYVDQLKFIDGRYRSNEIYVRSTDFNRTLISAMSNFIGFYGSTAQKGIDYPGDQSWPKGYLPVPIHTVYDETDYLGNPDRYCPRLDALTKLWPQTKEFKDALTKYQPLFANLTTQCGETINFDNIWNVYDSLFVERHYKMQISKVFDALYAEIKNCSDVTTDWIDGIGISPVNGINFTIEFPKIRGGPLLWALIDHMQGKLNCLKDPNSKENAHYCKWMNPLRYYVYSAHDSTVSALFSALGFKQSNWNETGFPHYSSCVTLELWQKPDKSSYVKVWYWPLDEVQEMKRPLEDLTKYVSGCNSDNCALDDFIKRSQPYKLEPSPAEYCANTDVGQGRGQKTTSTPGKSASVGSVSVALLSAAILFVLGTSCASA